jgi:hypothetical protein
MMLLDRAALQKLGGVGDRQIGLAGTGRADAEHQLGPLQRPQIGILRRRAGNDGLLAGRNLRHRSAWLFFSIVGRLSWSSAATAMRIAPSTSDRSTLPPFCSFS